MVFVGSHCMKKHFGWSLSHKLLNTSHLVRFVRFKVIEMESKLIQAIVFSMAIICSYSVKVKDRFNWKVISTHDLRVLLPTVRHVYFKFGIVLLEWLYLSLGRTSTKTIRFINSCTHSPKMI